jgi:hypothetical protein
MKLPSSRRARRRRDGLVFGAEIGMVPAEIDGRSTRVERRNASDETKVGEST